MLLSVVPFFGTSSHGLCAPRRLRAGPGEHHGRVRAWACCRCRRAGTGRTPFLRWSRRRVPRLDARPHHGCIRRHQSLHRGRAVAGRCRIPVGRCGRQRIHFVPAVWAFQRFATCSADSRDVPIIIEMKVDHREMGQAVAAEVLAASAVDRVCAASDGLGADEGCA